MHVSTIAHATATPPNKRTSLDDSCSPSFSGSSISTVGSDQHADASSSKAPEAHTRAHQSPTLLAARRRKQADDVPAITRALYSCISWFFPASPMPKIPLEKGYSQMDWLRLCQSNKNLNGLNGAPLRDNITMEEVKQHNTKEDAWMVFNGVVYNITPYLKFHPGGSDILVKVAGKDGTSLFMKYHAWVNIGALMGKCMVGRLALSPLQAQAALEIQQARQQQVQDPVRQHQEAAGDAGAGAAATPVKDSVQVPPRPAS